jgi:hypothetical protein
MAGLQRDGQWQACSAMANGRPVDLAHFSNNLLVSKDGLAAAGALAADWEGNDKPLDTGKRIRK